MFDGFRAHSIAAMDGMFDRTITINGVSKSHAMTGFRVGWLIAPKHIVDAYLKVHRYNAVCAPVPCQAAATAALTGPDDAVKQMIDEYSKRKNLLVSRINNDAPFMSTIGCKGGFFMFANVKELADLHRQTMISLLTHGSGKSFLGRIPSELVSLHDLSGSDSLLVMLYFAYAAGVLTTSGAFFGAGGDGFLRLSIAQSSDKIDLAVNKMAEALNALE